MDYEKLEQLYKEKEAFLKRGLALKEDNLKQEVEILTMREKLSASYCRPYQSEDTDFIDAALVKAWGEFPGIGKMGSSGKGNFSYSYARLEDVIDAVHPVLKKHELKIEFETTPDFVLVTKLKHSSGQWVGTRLQLLTFAQMPSDARNIDQAHGAHLSYQKRYQLLMILGIQPGGEDRDGEYEKK